MTEPEDQTGPEAQGRDVPPADAVPGEDERMLALAAHLLGLPVPILGPLLIWLLKKDESPFALDQAKEALNFQLAFLIVWTAMAVGAVGLSCTGIGLLLIPVMLAAMLGYLVLCILAAVESHKDRRYRYPLTLRLIA
ncbi:MAG: DUF4870 domain-containing protein [Phycisphaeraceae bacterium]